MGEDVELCLEIQVDSETKRILSNPHKCRSTLLDVTVIKPKELEAFGTQRTNTLRADEVRKLITSMEKQRRKKQKVLEKLKCDDTVLQIRKHDDADAKKEFAKNKERISSNSPVDDLERKDFIGIAESVEPLFCEIRRSLKNVETRITNMQDINLVISQTTVDETASEEFVISRHKKPSSLPSSLSNRNHDCYRIETAPHDIRSILLPQKKQKLLDKDDKVEGKCLCENCGIIGLLAECQKHPLLVELSESPSPSSHKQFPSPRKKPKINLENISKMRTKGNGDSYINHLSNRIKVLEERLAMQEEKVVPKDYFKKIISKMVTGLSPKIVKSKSDTSLRSPLKNYKKCSKLQDIQERPTEKSLQCQSSEALHCFRSFKEDKKPALKDDKGTITDEELFYGGYIWKWGEEILKPGIDLKNRIVNLLNDILGKFALSERGSIEAAQAESIREEAIRKIMRHMNAGNYDPRENIRHLSPREKSPKSNPQRVKSPYSKSDHKHNKNVDVSYINPKISLWRKDSPDVSQQKSNTSRKVSFWDRPSPEKYKVSQRKSSAQSPQWRRSSPEKFRTSQRMLEQRNNEQGKHEFLKIVSKAKQHQKDILWKNIWNQAKANGQTKNDKITIKIPVQSKGNKSEHIFETEISIGEIEQILKGVISLC
ncbi:uncharacterized protein LOC103315104 [Tribolium castaneum]|uniref:Uncharacterized protein n=1 Tax=Tribolium castaneum TaxID=7070 RepID=D6W9T4_TRICA|nr:PREDICTED: uncharacterized protein LOC103315104 [Tribolium castaneum]EEZ98110.1 hypothetical protein TcasGA2_TC000526 [Tribolium castaneum]|eukprot:XP_008201170.1 PREDICTED: uncharacterized protein LOC103315104 [Tribolium castaneum]